MYIINDLIIYNIFVLDELFIATTVIVCTIRIALYFVYIVISL